MGFGGVDEVLRAENARFIVLSDLLVNREVKETIETLWLGIGSRDTTGLA